MLSDFFENLHSQLSKKLTRKEHAELLKTLLEWLKEGGGEAVNKKIKDLVKRIEEE